MVLGYRELVRLKMTPNEVDNFNPPKGLDITWYDYDTYQGEVTASIVGCEWCPEDTYFVYREEVNHMLSKLKVAQDGIRDSKYPLHHIRSLTTPVNFIQDSEYDKLLSNAKINTIGVDKKTLNLCKSRSRNNKIDYTEDQKIFKVPIADIII